MKGRPVNSPEKSVTTVDELVAATKDTGVHHVVVRGSLANAPSIRLSPGQSLRGEDDVSEINFTAGTDGVQLSSDNRIQSIRLNATPDKRAIFNLAPPLIVCPAVISPNLSLRPPSITRHQQPRVSDSGKELIK